MKTLAMLKMEKNFIAVIEKGYPRKPYEKYLVIELHDRLVEEVKELGTAIKSNNIEGAKLECADVSNILDYIFERIVRVGELIEG